jgi:probable addiction module antidote protein
MNCAAYEKLGIKPFDAAEYLQSDEDCAAYLQACLEQADDAYVFAKALGDIARARGMMQLAKDTGLTREGLYKSLGEQGNPSLSTVMKVMHALVCVTIGPKLQPDFSP